ncbi:hypothetical protein, partial [Aeromonas sp. HMWF017]|uniref:hypothetical protein n=1 Tax=Aeromonas sp. HMWF017 TaxID=2056853 RepID=UPI0015E822CD
MRSLFIVANLHLATPARIRLAISTKGQYMLSQIQRFGGAMFTPVLLFPFAGMVVGIAIMLKNPMFVGESLA